MSNPTLDKKPLNDSDLDLTTDVLIIGGGPAGTWAAWSAANSGAKVVLVDKGFCGTSGAAAPSGNGVWYVPKDPEQREAAMASREAMGGFLADRNWMARVLDRTYDNMQFLINSNYPFRTDNNGQVVYRSLQGPDYLHFMRKKIVTAGVKILDHSPALELLVDTEGVVAGAGGINRQSGERWKIRAKAVVIATGGCAFLSKALGCNVLTGDGLLMAAEAGAEFSGMEFSNAYAICPAWSSVTKTLFYKWASFTYADGTIIEGAGSQRGRSVIAKTLMTQPVYARLDQGVDEQVKAWMRSSQPNFFVPFDRAGIDPFTQRFPVTLRLEGTVRGTGGIRIVDYTCASSVPGLYAAGDAATRELICGGFTGGGSHNAAWAMSSGYWSGESAATYALSLGDKAEERQVYGVGEAGLSRSGNQTFSPEEAIAQTQAEVFPYGRNLFRTATGLNESLERLNHLWQEIRNSQVTDNSQLLRSREAAAMVATARWMYNSGIQRQETRGMHKRVDHPQQDPNQHYRLLTGGLDTVWVKPETASPSRELAVV
ncbi:FAD-binding protein [Aetokthonos hydrillicola Thurmond2011]|uniref:FAD-binding protein n=1 Tax=Aetokthonos hydrillicola Thurmond2011 TaxID=2712845 RepID=A0AAP5M6D1_9CYAN|nr:FAD-binding protein [Aetokthonos hydrillicola]MBW4590331.1 FAD-binding protein [Aetokthonos hydrillicola CCALA 1050]MDR9896871.1 FAD-binding protein [Aetokthonos hydrillicola Thurmond2011]